MPVNETAMTKQYEKKRLIKRAIVKLVKTLGYCSFEIVVSFYV